MINELERLVAEEKQQRDAALAEQQRQAEEEAQRRRLIAINTACYLKRPLDGEERVSIPVRNGGSCCGNHTPGLLGDRGTNVAVVICHPWGPLGGSMYDFNVAVLVDLFVRGAGITTLRFAFRTGLDFGYSSAADLVAACDYLLNYAPTPPEKLILVGYSYGSLVVADVAPSLPACCAFCLVAPPLGTLVPLFGPRGDITAAAQRSDKAKLAVVGDRDAFCRVARFEDWASELAEPAESKVMTGPEFYQDCQSGCSHLRRQPINHHNVYQVVHLHLVPWLERVFGCPMSKLSEATGAVARPRVENAD